MGFIGQLFGTNGAGPQSAKIQTPVSGAQADASLGGVQNSMQQQQGMLQQLQAQGGLQNQSNIYNQMGQVAAGQGPNPAQAMLAQQTGANTANQAALMAGQRGVGDSAGLIARQAAMQGGANQQNAVGQGAAMQAQQSLSALGQQGQMANQMASQQIQQGQANAAQSQNLYGQQLGAIGASNNAQVGSTSSINQYNAGAAQSQNALVGGLLGGVGAAGAAYAGKKAEGGEISMPQQAASMSARFIAAHAQPYQAGGSVAGQAAVAGNSEKNDTVSALLSPGEVVIPRSVMSAKDPAKAAAEFVRQVLAKKGKGA